MTPKKVVHFSGLTLSIPPETGSGQFFINKRDTSCAVCTDSKTGCVPVLRDQFSELLWQIGQTVKPYRLIPGGVSGNNFNILFCDPEFPCNDLDQLPVCLSLNWRRSELDLQSVPERTGNAGF